MFGCFKKSAYPGLMLCVSGDLKVEERKRKAIRHPFSFGATWMVYALFNSEAPTMALLKKKKNTHRINIAGHSNSGDRY